MLQSKTGIVFGISSKHSLGFHIAKAWTEAQAKQVVLVCESTELCDKVKFEAKREGWWLDSVCTVVKCNVNVDTDLKNVFTNSFEHVDMVMHSLAHAPRQALRNPLTKLSRQDFLITMETSAYSLLAVAKHANFSPAGGSLTSLTFNASQRVVPGYAAMAPAKAALETISLYLAAELGPKSIRCNCISSGAINTPAARAIPNFHEMVQASQMRSPLRRSTSAQDVANASVFLASDMANGITGQIIKVDCGESMVLQ